MRGYALLIAILTIWYAPANAHADGGAIRFCEVRAGRRITVFTSPTPLRAGLVDVSVLVQDLDSGKPLLGLPILVSAYPILDPRRRILETATADAATNKILHAAILTLPEAGAWRIEVALEKSDPHQTTIIFDVEVAEPPLPWIDMSLWLGWPLFAIGLFAVHQWLVHRRLSLPHILA